MARKELASRTDDRDSKSHQQSNARPTPSLLRRGLYHSFLQGLDTGEPPVRWVVGGTTTFGRGGRDDLDSFLLLVVVIGRSARSR